MLVSQISLLFRILFVLATLKYMKYLPNLIRSKFQIDSSKFFHYYLIYLNKSRSVLPWKVGLSPYKCSVFDVSFL